MKVLRVTQKFKLAAIALFVMVDLVAVAFTIRHVNQRPVSQGAPMTVPTETRSVPVPKPAEAKAEKPTGLAVKNDVVARFVKGACDNPTVAGLELSTDRAASFKEIALPLEANADADGDRSVAVTSILDVAVKSSTELSIIGTDVNCKSYLFTTKSGGEDWKRAATGSAWFVAKDMVVSPAGTMDPECDALSVWPISDRNARVGCKDGQIRGTDDSGVTWIGLGVLEGLSAISFSTIRDGVSIAADADCASRVLFTASAGGNWAPLGCIDKNKKGAAIGGTAGTLAALVDGNVFVSADQGKTWRRP